ncbi:MAG TPA: hypothetical protein VMF86_14315 [Stellaceae bacterium]|nr:hypothetical protein [Stellaceae bacterium]
MDFTYGRYPVFSKVEPGRPFLIASLGRYVLSIQVGFTPNNPPRGALVVDDLRLGISFGSNKQDFGIARPYGDYESCITVQRLVLGQQQEARRQFGLYLSASMLEALEAVRNAEDAVFQIRVSGNITGYAAEKADLDIRPPENILWSENTILNAPPAWVFRPERRFQDIVLTVPQSEWITILDKAGYQKTVFLEIPVPTTGELAIALKHLKEAQAAFVAGRYDDVGVACRKALEGAVSVEDSPWPEEAKNGDGRRNMTIEERFRLSWFAVRHLTNPTHHANGMRADFNRPMAQYLLGATSLALSLASKERNLFINRKDQEPGEK